MRVLRLLDYISILIHKLTIAIENNVKKVLQWLIARKQEAKLDFTNLILQYLIDKPKKINFSSMQTCQTR